MKIEKEEISGIRAKETRKIYKRKLYTKKSLILAQDER